jgi:hypothetical protein
MYQDDRTAEQMETHTFIVGGYDPWMSGWGNAPGGSYAYWAARAEDAGKVENWVRRKKDLKNVWVTTAKTLMLKHPKKPKGKNLHTHVYVVDDGHPALAA